MYSYQFLQAERKLDKDQLASLSSQRSVQAYLEEEKENITRIIKQMLAVGDIFKSENLQVIIIPGFYVFGSGDNHQPPNLHRWLQYHLC